MDQPLNYFILISAIVVGTAFFQGNFVFFLQSDNQFNGTNLEGKKADRGFSNP